MKTTSSFFGLHLVVLCVAALMFPASAMAKPRPASDAVAEELARRGLVPVDAAGDYVQRGTMRIQVLAKLGRPNYVTPDGAWIYRGLAVRGSGARGALVVRFAEGRVSELALATPAVVAALRDGGGRNGRPARVAVE